MDDGSDPKALVLMPYGRHRTWGVDVDFGHYVYAKILDPALRAAGFSPYRIDHLPLPESSAEINALTHHEIRTAPLVLADLSYPFGSVSSELGRRDGAAFLSWHREGRPLHTVLTAMRQTSLDHYAAVTQSETRRVTFYDVADDEQLRTSSIAELSAAIRQEVSKAYEPALSLPGRRRPLARVAGNGARDLR